MKVLFYYNAENRLNECIQTIFRAFQKQKAAYIFSDSDDFLNNLNRALWEKALFLPHVFANDPNANFTPYLLSNNLENLKESHPLIFIPFKEIEIVELNHFPFIYEIIDNDEIIKNYGRSRVQNYKDVGFDVQFINLLQ